MPAAKKQDPRIAALLELERREMQQPGTMPDELKAKLDGYRQQGLVPRIGGGKAMSEATAGKYEGMVSSYADLKNALGGFKDDFGGNTVTGGLENTLQSLNSNIGTAGQREWWASFRSLDNQIRNDLFGSALTPNEKKSYEETTISPNMDPSIIKGNLAKRAEIIRAATARRTNFFKASGYPTEAVDALAGEYAPDFASDKPHDVADPLAGKEPKFNDQIEQPLGFRMDPKDEEKLAAFGSTAKTPEELIAFGKALGVNLTPENAKEVVDYYAKGGDKTPGFNYSKADDIVKEAARARLGGANSPVVAAPAGFGDTATFGLQNRVIAGAKTAFNDRPYAENLANTRADASVMQEDNPISSTVGQVAGLIGGEAAIGRMAPKVAKFMSEGSVAGKLGKGIAADTAYGAGYGAAKGDDPALGALKGAQEGALGSAIGRFGAKGLGRALAPVGGAGIDLLRSKGVQITPMQALGETASKVEEKLQSLPVLGDMIGSARKKGLKGFNRAVLNDALASIGDELPPNVAGPKAMEYAQKSFNRVYDEARSRMQLVPDQPLTDALDDLAKRAAGGEFSDEVANRLAKIYDANIAKKLSAGSVSGDDYKAIHSKLGKLADDAKRGQNLELSSAIGELQGILDSAARRSSPPEAAHLMDAADVGYARFVRAENAAKMRAGETGEFTPAQYDAAVQKGDSSVRSKAYLRGEALGQDMAEAGKTVLRDRVPDSGTGARLLMGGAAIGATPLADAYDPTGAGKYVAGGLAAAYLPGVRRGVVKGLLDRPSIVRKGGQILSRNDARASALALPYFLSGE